MMSELRVLPSITGCIDLVQTVISNLCHALDGACAHHSACSDRGALSPASVLQRRCTTSREQNPQLYRGHSVLCVLQQSGRPPSATDSRGAVSCHNTGRPMPCLQSNQVYPRLEIPHRVASLADIADCHISPSRPAVATRRSQLAQRTICRI